MRSGRRVVIVVCDGLGVGAAPDAEAYGDSGSDTLRHVLERYPAPLPNLERLGLLSLAGVGRPTGARGKMAELSAGKDTTTGHWEMMGLVVERPFPLYPEGFPAEVVEPFERTRGPEGSRQSGGVGHGDPGGARSPSTSRPAGRSSTRREIRSSRSPPTRTSGRRRGSGTCAGTREAC